MVKIKTVLLGIFLIVTLISCDKDIVGIYEQQYPFGKLQVELFGNNTYKQRFFSRGASDSSVGTWHTKRVKGAQRIVLKNWVEFFDPFLLQLNNKSKTSTIMITYCDGQELTLHPDIPE